MKFRVERDVLADAVAWTARSLPHRPSVPVLAGLLIETADSGDGLVLSASTTRPRPARRSRPSVQDDGRALVSGRLLAEIAAALPAKPVDMALDGHQGRADLRQRPVQPADDAGRGVPAAARRCPRRRARSSSDDFAQAVAQAVTAAGRDDMLPMLTGVRLEIEGSDLSLLATDRFRLSPARARLGPERHRRLGQRPGPGARAGRHRQVARPRGSEVTIAAVVGSGTGDGIIGFEGDGRRRVPPHDDPAARRRVPPGAHTVPGRARHHRRQRRTGPLVEAVKRVSLVAERNTAVRLSSPTDGLTLDAGSGDEAQAPSDRGDQVNGEAITTASTRRSCSTASRAIEAPVVRAGVHPALQARRHHRRAGDRTATRTPRSGT